MLFPLLRKGGVFYIQIAPWCSPDFLHDTESSCGSLEEQQSTKGRGCTAAKRGQ